MPSEVIKEIAYTGKGTGLGLSIAHSIIEKHKSKIDWKALLESD